MAIWLSSESSAWQAGGSRKAVLHASEIKLRAERRAGMLLREMELQSGARDGKTGLHEGTPLLSDLGINKTQSHRLQVESEVPETQFVEYVAEIRESEDRDLTSKGLYGIGKKLRADAALDGLLHPTMSDGEREAYAAAAEFIEWATADNHPTVGLAPSLG